MARTITKGRLKTVDGSEQLVFQFNPTTITERRGVKFNFSNAQGQYMPISQFGQFEPTEINFELFFFKNSGLEEELMSLRRLVTPKSLSAGTYYEQNGPSVYHLNLANYGAFRGVIEDVSIKVEKYHYSTMVPQHISAQVRFKAVSGGYQEDITYNRSITGRS